MAAFLALALAALAGCAGTPPKPHAVEIDPATRVTRPGPGKALVYFLRTSNYGWMMPSPIFDNDKYIGSIAMEQGASAYVAKKKTHIAYETSPGKHMFTVYAENVDFLPAELSAGKTYFVQVRPVMGMWKIRFYLTPQQGQLPQHELDEVLAQAGQLKPTEDGYRWAQENAADYQKTRAEWWEKYQARPAAQRLELRPEHGR
jgi:hypothetical protein